MKKPKSRQTVLIIAVILVAVGAMALLFLTRPKPPGRAESSPGTLVETRPVEARETHLRVSTQGTVTPVRSVQLTAQVSGVITAVSPQLEPGKNLRKGQMLVQIDPSDYRLAVEQSAAALIQAQADLALERGRQEVAEQEWEYFRQRRDTDTPGGSRELALRQPQLAAALAQVEQAEANLKQAKLNLSRTTLTAPFDATVEAESAAVGGLVSPQTPIATLHDRQRVWVEAAVPVSQLGSIVVPDGGDRRASPAEVHWEVGPKTPTYKGRVLGLLPSLSEQGRMARVLIEVEQPDPPGGRGLLLLGAYVDVVIHSLEQRRLLRVPRDALHNGDEVFVFEAGQLHIAKPTIVWRTQDAVFVEAIEGAENGARAALREGVQVVVSPLVAAVEGMPLRRQSPRPEIGPSASGRSETEGQQPERPAKRRPPPEGQPVTENRTSGSPAGEMDGN